ncbi:MAG: ABC transporter ATP-binding protein [Lactobacillus sp.]|jgi:ABC-type Fe3+/spermidine/putrescine transport system ATPase subunit|nr:ABC transporter ATP-binding protein [Lactobacillus sp.]
MGLEIKDVSLHYGRKQILKHINLEVAAGEILTLFGPSGVGKTTILKLIAGMQPLQTGQLDFQGDFSQKRTILVLQDFWLFPHMTVFENIAFGLKARHVKAAQISQAVDAMLTTLELQGLATHFPDQLSGGQQQRVALARAIILKPTLLLLDEPFASLDSSLRQKMHQLLLKLRQQYHFGVILVTHDRDEAFELSDRLAVLIDGEIQQVGTPQAIYERPQTRQVAAFIGGMNFLTGVVAGQQFQVAAQEITVANPNQLTGPVQLVIPYEAAATLGDTGLTAVVEWLQWQPGGVLAQLRLGQQTLVLTNIQGALQPGDVVHLQFGRDLQVVAN